MSGCLEIMYERLAAFLLENLVFDDVSVILEAGCGGGQLTIPFVKGVSKIKKNFKVIAFDISAGPYEGDLEILNERIRKERLEALVFSVKGDVRDMKEMACESVDLIISNELLCDLDKKGLGKAIQEFYRILRRGGMMAHGELNPIPENARALKPSRSDKNKQAAIENSAGIPCITWASLIWSKVISLT